MQKYKTPFRKKKLYKTTKYQTRDLSFYILLTLFSFFASFHLYQRHSAYWGSSDVDFLKHFIPSRLHSVLMLLQIESGSVNAIHIANIIWKVDDKIQTVKSTYCQVPKPLVDFIFS